MSTLKVQEIQHTGGTTAQTIDSTGRILTPARPSILLDFDDLSTSSGYEEIGNGSTLPFRNKVQGVGITQDVSEYAIIIPVSGLYQVNMQTLTDAAEGIELAMTVNGVASSNIILRNYTHETRSCSIHAAYEFSASDVVRVINNTGASRGFYRQLLSTPDTGRYSYWSTYLIG